MAARQKIFQVIATHKVTGKVTKMNASVGGVPPSRVTPEMLKHHYQVKHKRFLNHDLQITEIGSDDRPLATAILQGPPPTAPAPVSEEAPVPPEVVTAPPQTAPDPEPTA